VAAGLIVAERTGRAIRRPIVESMVSHTRDEVGGGRAFGINEGLDQVGATVGPLVMALVLAARGDYRSGFAVLLISAVLCLAMVGLTRVRYPRPQAFEQTASRPVRSFSRSYWLYVAGAAMIGFGFTDFALIAFHLQQTHTVPDNWIPFFTPWQWPPALLAASISALCMIASAFPY
jgi:MFS transporter